MDSTAHPPDWYADAACIGHQDVMILSLGSINTRGGYNGTDRDRIKKAKAICRTCPVFTPCYAAAFDGPDEQYHDAVMAGTDPRERRTIRKFRRRLAREAVAA